MPFCPCFCLTCCGFASDICNNVWKSISLSGFVVEVGHGFPDHFQESIFHGGRLCLVCLCFRCCFAVFFLCFCLLGHPGNVSENYFCRVSVFSLS